MDEFTQGTDSRQLLEDALSQLDTIKTKLESEELSEKIDSILKDIRTAVNSLDYSTGREVAADEAEDAVERLHDTFIDYSEEWENHLEEYEEVDEEIIPDIERAIEDLAEVDYKDHREQLDDQWNIDVNSDERF